jgi:Sugar (and other) transporter
LLDWIICANYLKKWISSSKRFLSILGIDSVKCTIFYVPCFRWRVCFWVATVPATLLAICMEFCAESPHWLYKVFFWTFLVTCAESRTLVFALMLRCLTYMDGKFVCHLVLRILPFFLWFLLFLPCWNKPYSL